jgi:hypothetical protein
MKTKFPIVFSLTIAALMWLAASTAQAQTYTANLSGPGENPPNASPATAFGTVTLNLATHTLQVDVSWSNLTAPANAAHIHAPATAPANAGVAVGLTGFPAATSGTYSNSFNTLDPAIYNGAYLSNNGGTAAGAEAALASDLAAGHAYLNIHNANFAGGEIRGFLIPEPATIGLIAIGGIGLFIAARRSRRS